MNKKLTIFGHLCMVFALVSHCPAKRLTEADLLDKVRASVVTVEIHVTDPIAIQALPLPDGVKHCFGESRSCIEGTGVFINSNGDVLTAAHVAIELQQILSMLTANRIAAHLDIGVSLPNIETTHVTMVSGINSFQAQIVAVDVQHDLAVFHATRNPFTQMPTIFGGAGAKDIPKPSVAFAKLSVERPRDGDTVFACGHPLGEMSLVSTMGTIASAWYFEVPLIARSLPNQNTTDIYQLDLRVNPGNSGGPVFRSPDGAVIGIVIETTAGTSPLANAMPSKYVADFLRSSGISWTTAERPK